MGASAIMAARIEGNPGMARTVAEARVVHLRLICLAPPEQQEDAPIEFGLQDKRQVIRAGDRQADGSVHYHLDVEMTGGGGTAAPRFSGPFVHGTAVAPFLYLSLRREGPEDSPWLRRLKIPLTSITQEQIEAIDRLDGGVLEATVSGAGSATVPVLGGGWIPRATASA